MTTSNPTSLMNASSLVINLASLMNASFLVINPTLSSVGMDCNDGSNCLDLPANIVDLEHGGKNLVITNSVDVAPNDWRKLFATALDQSLQFFPP